MSAQEPENRPETYETRETQRGSPMILVGVAFVGGILLAAIVLYLSVIAPRSADHAEALETIAELEEELALLDDRDAELRETAESLETALEEERARLSAVEEENESLRNELEEARELAIERGATVDRLEQELAQLHADMEAMEARAGEAIAEAEAIANVEAIEAALADREAELEEVTEAYLAALERVERAETERDEIREQMQREIAALEERIMAVQEEREVVAPAPEQVEPYRYINLLSAVNAAMHEGVVAEDPEVAREALTRAGDILDTIEAEFPERSVDSLRQRIRALEN